MIVYLAFQLTEVVIRGRYSRRDNHSLTLPNQSAYRIQRLLYLILLMAIIPSIPVRCKHWKRRKFGGENIIIFLMVINLQQKIPIAQGRAGKGIYILTIHIVYKAPTIHRGLDSDTSAYLYARRNASHIRYAAVN